MVDSTDMVILKTIEKNARISFTKLAQKLNISEAAVRKRIKKLESENLIIGYRAMINYKKLGFSNKVVVGVDSEPNLYFDVINKLREFKEIRELNTSSGDHMIMFEVWIKNMDDLNNILERVNSIHGVTQSCPSIIHENMK